ncbi:hypothetical protein GINT2_000867 [Glugoides intestinalis]
MTKLLSISLKYFYLVSSSGNCSPPAAKKSKMDPGVAQRLDEPFECHETGTQSDPSTNSHKLENDSRMDPGVAQSLDQLLECHETAGTQSDPSPNSHKLENDSWMDPEVAQSLDEPFEYHETGKKYDPRDISSILKNNPWMDYGVAQSPDELVKYHETAGTQSDPSTNSHKLENDSWMDYGVAQSLDQLLECHETAGTQSDPSPNSHKLENDSWMDPEVAQSLDEPFEYHETGKKYDPRDISSILKNNPWMDYGVAQRLDELVKCHETAGTQSNPSTNSHKLENDSRMDPGVAQSPDKTHDILSIIADRAVTSYNFKEFETDLSMILTNNYENTTASSTEITKKPKHDDLIANAVNKAFQLTYIPFLVKTYYEAINHIIDCMFASLEKKNIDKKNWEKIIVPTLICAILGEMQKTEKIEANRNNLAYINEFVEFHYKYRAAKIHKFLTLLELSENQNQYFKKILEDFKKILEDISKNENYASEEVYKKLGRYICSFIELPEKFQKELFKDKAVKVDKAKVDKAKVDKAKVDKAKVGEAKVSEFEVKKLPFPEALKPALTEIFYLVWFEYMHFKTAKPRYKNKGNLADHFKCFIKNDKCQVNSSSGAEGSDKKNNFCGEKKAMLRRVVTILFDFYKFSQDNISFPIKTKKFFVNNSKEQSLDEIYTEIQNQNKKHTFPELTLDKTEPAEFIPDVLSLLISCPNALPILQLRVMLKKLYTDEWAIWTTEDQKKFENLVNFIYIRIETELDIKEVGNSVAGNHVVVDSVVGDSVVVDSVAGNSESKKRKRGRHVAAVNECDLVAKEIIHYEFRKIGGVTLLNEIKNEVKKLRLYKAKNKNDGYKEISIEGYISFRFEIKRAMNFYGLDLSLKKINKEIIENLERKEPPLSDKMKELIERKNDLEKTDNFRRKKVYHNAQMK